MNVSFVPLRKQFLKKETKKKKRNKRKVLGYQEKDLKKRNKEKRFRRRKHDKKCDSKNICHILFHNILQQNPVILNTRQSS